ncbi:MAG: acylneuraminate cytidylyltransferase family protein [Alphaproteobacteria bacterium]
MPTAIIPARGGSKRLPRKNILPLGGSPAITYPIKAAIESDLFDRVIVSTEDNEIADIAAGAGAEIHDRKGSLASDRAGVVDVCLDVLDAATGAGQSIESICCVYATAVMIRAEDLVKAAAVFENGPPSRPNGVMCVSEYNYYPHSALYETDGGLSPFFPEMVNKSRHEVPRLLASNGTFYMVRSDVLRKDRSFYVDRLAAYVVDKYRALDIDTPEDYAFATRVFPLLQEL